MTKLLKILLSIKKYKKMIKLLKILLSIKNIKKNDIIIKDIIINQKT